jgi:curved DNA-binding protein CbpA
MEENLYYILGVEQNASQDDIKKAWKDKHWILSADHMQGAPESAKQKAEADLKEVNRAFEVLGNSVKRKEYDRILQQNPNTNTTQSLSAPKPTIDPYHIEFKNAAPGEVKKASFTIFNTGGPYSKINISNPDSWLRVVAWRSLSTSDELPLKVEIEAQGKDWYKRYSDVICISLDSAQGRVNVLLTTRFRLEVKDYKWHDIDFENLKAWVKKRKDFLDTGQELPGKTFSYRLNKISHKYQFRLRHSYKSATYDPYH